MSRRVDSYLKRKGHVDVGVTRFMFKGRRLGISFKNVSAIVAGDLSLPSFADVFFLFPFEKPQNKLKPRSIRIVYTKRDHCGWMGGGDRPVEVGVQGVMGGARGEFSEADPCCFECRGGCVFGGSCAVQVR